jgi:hypothetical protein
VGEVLGRFRRVFGQDGRDGVRVVETLAVGTDALGFELMGAADTLR